VIKKLRERGGHSPRWAAEPEKIKNNKGYKQEKKKCMKKNLRNLYVSPNIISATILRKSTDE
jgi:hypothetical protein